MCKGRGIKKAHLANWREGLLEEIIVELLKAGPCEGLRQVHTLCQALNLNADLVM